MADRIRFTVWRDAWLRGETGSLLIDGKRCCLGFLGQACGLGDNELSLAGTPEETRRFKAWPEPLLDITEDEDGASVRDSIACQDIVHINDDDDEDMSDEQRESELTALFASMGIDVEFRDGDGK